MLAGESARVDYIIPHATGHRAYKHADLLSPMQDCSCRGVEVSSEVVKATRIVMVRGRRNFQRLHPTVIRALKIILGGGASSSQGINGYP